MFHGFWLLLRQLIPESRPGYYRTGNCIFPLKFTSVLLILYQLFKETNSLSGIIAVQNPSLKKRILESDEWHYQRTRRTYQTILLRYPPFPPFEGLPAGEAGGQRGC